MADDQDPKKADVPVEEEHAVWTSRRRMAWVSLWAIIIPTLFIIVHISDPNVLSKLADLMSWYYLSLASIVGAFLGFTTWANIVGRGGWRRDDPDAQ
jgi:drug/metabolite transporter (DMT)-like permease